tara:strand:+ start:84 stop:443 length:360 start_codon:yes stop_codon:yes gene_type:complete
MKFENINDSKIAEEVQSYYLLQYCLAPAKSRGDKVFKHFLDKFSGVKQCLLERGYSFKQKPSPDNSGKDHLESQMSNFLFINGIMEFVMNETGEKIEPPENISRMASIYVQMEIPKYYN